MRKTAQVIILMVYGGCAGEPAPEDSSDEVYASDRVPRFELEISAEGLYMLEDDPRSYVPATFRHGDEVIGPVGVRLKGSFTFRSLHEKPSFKIKFNEYVKGQTFRGLRGVTLNNDITDWSYISERLSYSVFRNAGLPAPRANSAEVHVNGELYGLYTNVETIDKTFLARWFGSSKGNLYEMGEGISWIPGNEYLFELETNKDIGDRSDLVALFAAVTEAGDEALLEDVAHILDPELFLRYCAIEGLVNQWDGFAYSIWQFPNNHHLYHQPATGTFVLLPWGMDLSMKAREDAWHIDLYTTSSEFLERCLGSAPCKAEYERVLAEELERFESMNLIAAAHEMYDQIAPLVYRDPRKEHTNEEFEWTFQEVIEVLKGRPDNVREQIAAQ
jgi:spore coat protein CotH